MRVTAFRFNVGDHVAIKLSNEVGFITGRMQELNKSNEYQVQYLDNAGCAQKQWWTEDDLEFEDVHFGAPARTSATVIEMRPRLHA